MTKEWEYYLTKWQGSAAVDDSVFARRWELAMKYIVEHTFYRASKDDDAVMTCACAIVDCLGKYDSNSVPEIASESADDFSTTYRDGGELTREKNAEITEIIRLYLPQELLYRGLV